MRIEMEKEGSEMLQGICDIHMYASPSFYNTRYLDEIELAQQARDVGYKAVLVKCHHTCNADRAQTVRKVVPGINFFGGIVLNHPVGGLNPEAVEAAIAFGAKEIWMPSMHAAHHIEFTGAPGYAWGEKTEKKKRPIKGISVLDSEGKILPEVYEILDLIAEADIILGSAHLSVEEVFELVKAAKKQGVRKILIQHPEEGVTKWTPNQQVEIAGLGAVLEHNAGGLFLARIDPRLIAEAIKEHGPSCGVLASGLGNKNMPHPIDGMRMFIRLMLENGISGGDIDLMTKAKPAELLGI